VRPLVSNRVLRALPEREAALLWPHLRPLDLPVRYELFKAHTSISNVYFLEHGFASVVARTPSGASLEVGIIGREGMVGVPVIFGKRRTPYECYVQVAAEGFVMSADDLWSAMTRSWALADVLLGFAHAFLAQVTQTALANGRFAIQPRLARWLLMAHDRLDGDDVPLTHEFLAMMLGVRRAGITVALRELEASGAVRTVRGHVRIRDRRALEAIAGDCYGLPESELAKVGLAPR
jgi:CRP-like cAMP-binding protein